MLTFQNIRAGKSVGTGVLIALFAFLILALPASADPIDDTYKYAWGENIGWLNWGTPEGAVDVGAAELTGYVWGENIGWISLNCSNTASCGTVDYQVTRAAGELAGYAWGENVGWISFNCSNTASCGTVDYGVTLSDVTGDFAGYAWGENVGWIVFNCSTTSSCGTVDYKVQAVLAATPTPTPTPGGGGGGGGSFPTPTPSVSPGVTPSPTPTPTPIPGVTPPVFTPPASPSPAAPASPPSITPSDVIEFVSQKIDAVIARVVGLVESLGGFCQGPLGIASCSVTAIGLLALLLALLSALIQLEILALLNLALQAMGLKRKAKVWGTVYDSGTKRPIPLAKLELFDAAGRVMETRFADRDGRYGFLISPASLHADELRVHIRAAKPGYRFPSARSIIGTDYFVYDRVYQGGELVLHGESVLRFNIPMDLVSGRRSLLNGLGEKLFGVLGDRLMSLAFFLGLIIIPLNVWMAPTTKNIIIAAAFFAVNGIRMLALYRPYGRTMDALTGKALPFALVTISDMQGNRVGFSVSDEYGRYIISAERGKDYELAITTPANVSPQRTVRQRMTVLKRFFRRTWITRTLRV